MAQAYPQFTPVQIWEAGQRAMSEGRHEYAAQFFQHLIDHYAETPEAAAARDAMARLYPDRLGTAPQHATNGRPSVGPTQTGTHESPRAHHPDALRTNGSINPHAPGQQPSMNSSQAPHGLTPGGAANELRDDTMPRHIARHSANGPASQVRHEAPARRLFVPAPEKHYIIGRVIAGLLLLVGGAGIFGGIGLTYIAITAPTLFATFGVTDPAHAVFFSGGMLLGALLALLIAQMATAVFDGADASADVARLERYRAGDIDEDS